MDCLRKIVNKISKLIPIQDKIILESNPDFSDNTYALFKKMIDRGINENYKIIWIHRGKYEFHIYHNVKLYHIKDEKGIKKLYQKIKLFYLFSSAKFSFSSHKIYSLADVKSNQFFIHLTHGFHFKNGIGRHFRPQKVSFLITLSDFDKTIAAKVYNIEKNKMLNLGYPRNDLLGVKDESHRIEKYRSIFNENYNKIILWLPTFRTHKKAKLKDGGVEGNENDLPILHNDNSFKILNNKLQEKNILLMIKPHPAQKINQRFRKQYDNIKIIDDNFLLNNHIDLYNIIAYSDCLITDYSSVFIDYLLLDRPIIFTIDDFYNYLNTTGFMVSSPLDFMPGQHVKDIDELMKSIDDVCDGKDVYKKERNKIKDLIHKNQNFDSSSQILDYFGLKNNRESST